jgi:hypothetical protein
MRKLVVRMGYRPFSPQFFENFSLTLYAESD